ncbi:RNA 2',3'-cyclic phosphodiesterase [bacterium]|nr:RNA 2',3'-cyclic phosphodiesterase [bacterium]
MNPVNTPAVRTFIAIDLPSNIRKDITLIQQNLRPHFSRAIVSWVRPENIHLTLKFLGNVLMTDIPKIITACEFVKKDRAFELQLNGIGFFPGLHKPKVLWCGYESSAVLSEVQNQIETALIPMGFVAENKPFVAHLTLARIKEISSNPAAPCYVDMASVQEYFKKTPVSILHPVRSIKLIKSRLSSKGSEYTVLHEWKLKSD